MENLNLLWDHDENDRSFEEEFSALLLEKSLLLSQEENDEESDSDETEDFLDDTDDPQWEEA